MKEEGEEEEEWQIRWSWNSVLDNVLCAMAVTLIATHASSRKLQCAISDPLRTLETIVVVKESGAEAQGSLRASPSPEQILTHTIPHAHVRVEQFCVNILLKDFDTLMFQKKNSTGAR